MLHPILKRWIINNNNNNVYIKSGLPEDKPKLSSQQSNKTGRNKTPTRWDPLRGRKCSKKRLKFLNKRRKQQKYK
ncbi:unnamed protein product [Trichobilharzia regenti]|nr:unnamed protein product [Trichobilharzia regenti]